MSVLSVLSFLTPNEKCAVQNSPNVFYRTKLPKRISERFFVRRILFRPTSKPLNKFEKILFTVLFAVRELYVYTAPNEKCAVQNSPNVFYRTKLPKRISERFFVRRILFRPTSKPLNKFEKILFTVLFAVRELYVYTAPNEKCAVGKINQI